MRSPAYRSRLGLQDSVQLSTDIYHSLFEGGDETRLGCENGSRINIEPNKGINTLMIGLYSNQGPQINQIKRVVIIGISPNHDKLGLRKKFSFDDGSSIRPSSPTQKKRRTRFRLFYENGDERDVEAANNSNLYRFLIRQCRETKK